jgi:hypothetical protein
VGFDVLTTCQPSTVWCSRERLPAAAAQSARFVRAVAPRIFFKETLSISLCYQLKNLVEDLEKKSNVYVWIIQEIKNRDPIQFLSKYQDSQQAFSSDMRL